MTSHSQHPLQTLVIRHAHTTDQGALARLAQLDGRRPLGGERVLVAEVDGLLLAALSLDGGEAIADPFHPTSAMLEVLKVRAAQLRGEGPPRRGGRLRSRLARLRRPATARPAMAPETPGNAALMIPRDRG